MIYFLVDIYKLSVASIVTVGFLNAWLMTYFGNFIFDFRQIHCKCLQTNDRQTNIQKCYFYSQMNQKIEYSNMCFQQVKYVDI